MHSKHKRLKDILIIFLILIGKTFFFYDFGKANEKLYKKIIGIKIIKSREQKKVIIWLLVEKY